MIFDFRMSIVDRLQLLPRRGGPSRCDRNRRELVRFLKQFLHFAFIHARF
jgi:hypothetical protein